MHLVYPTSICKWDIHDSYSCTRPVQAMHNLYKLALALRILFYFLRLLYIHSSPYSTRGTHYKLIKYITFRVLLCVTHSDYLAIPTGLNKRKAIFKGKKLIFYKLVEIKEYLYIISDL
jgi:hypothetical protein